MRSTFKPADEATQAFCVTLHKANHRDEFVTHLENLQPNGQPKNPPEYYWGHYFGNDFEKARNSLINRAAIYGLEVNVQG